MEQGTFDFPDEPAAPVKLCECGCGKPAPIAAYSRKRNGSVKGQPQRFIRGHYKRSEPTLFVEVGQRFGRSVVIDAEVRMPRSGKVKTVRAARMLCDCGKEYVRPLSALLCMTNASCGCSHGRFIDRLGLRFGKLVAIQRLENVPNGGGTRWLCRCDCGTEVVATGSALSAGHTQSCGCKRRRPKTGYLPGEAGRYKILNAYKQGAKQRGLAWELTKEDFCRLTVLDCFYCGSSPSMVGRAGPYSGECLYNGLDRIDSDLGYMLDNVVPCCAICNRAKRDLPYGDFMAWIGRLTEYRRSRPELTPSRLLAGGA